MQIYTHDSDDGYNPRSLSEYRLENSRVNALEASIIKWESNATATRVEEVRLGWADCNLCARFRQIEVLKEVNEVDCKGCPVAEYTGHSDCKGSPYESTYEAWKHWRLFPDDKGFRDTFCTAARAEVKFLRHLRKCETKWKYIPSISRLILRTITRFAK